MHEICSQIMIHDKYLSCFMEISNFWCVNKNQDIYCNELGQSQEYDWLWEVGHLLKSVSFYERIIESHVEEARRGASAEEKSWQHQGHVMYM